MWLKVEDLKEMNIPRRTYHRKISSGAWQSREVGKSRNGKPIREVLLESLPHDSFILNRRILTKPSKTIQEQL